MLFLYFMGNINIKMIHSFIMTAGIGKITYLTIFTLYLFVVAGTAVTVKSDIFVLSIGPVIEIDMVILEHSMDCSTVYFLYTSRHVFNKTTLTLSH